MDRAQRVPGAVRRSRLPRIPASLGIMLCTLFAVCSALLSLVAYPLAVMSIVFVGLTCAWTVWSALHNPSSPASREAQQLAEHRSRIIAAVSHEIRNPLTMIAAAVRLIQDTDDSLTVSQRKFVTVVLQQADHAVSIADDLLVQARIDAGKFSLNPTLTDLNKLVREVVDATRPIASHRSQTLFVDTPQYVPPLLVDPRAIRQALSNLLMNAVRHTAEGRTIITRVRDNANAAVLMVLDDGDGMSKDDRRRLFEPFESGDLLGDGTGLGLSITRQLVEAHGGRILVDTRLNEGTSIMLTLPRQP